MNARDDRWAARLESADLRQLTQHAPDMLMVVDLEHRIQFINWTVAGLDVDQVIGSDFLAYVSPEQRAAVHESLEHVRRTREPASYRSIYVSPQSSAPNEWESRVGPVIEEGVVVGFAVFARDVTERNAQARELTRFFELSADMLCVLDEARSFRRVSSSFSTTLGYSTEELQGKPLAELIHKGDREATLAHLLSVAEGQRDVHFEARFQHKAGACLLLSWRVRHDSETRVMFAVARDITQERNLEFQLRESQKMDAVGQLAGGLAHDFNNLMLAVLANVEFAAEELNEDAPLHEYLAQISDAATRATVLTKQLLAFSRREPIRRVAVDVNELTRTLMLLLRRLIPANVEVEFVPDDGMPKLDCDPNQLEQILINLCINARDAMPQGGRITIETAATVLEDRIRASHPWAKPGLYGVLTITDSGVGMTKEVCDRIFEPFFTTKGPGKGTGLGLATVYAIVKQHGGLVHVCSEPGQGSSFKVYIPVAEQLASDIPEKRGSIQPGGAETILVAEDEPLVRQVVTQVLERAGYRVLGAKNGKEALELLKQNQGEVRLVLLDVMMPELSGPEAYYRIRQTMPDLPVLFSSGYSNDARFAHSVPRECILIEKPYRSGELLRAVRLALTARAPE